jgi:hypothetical protein
VEDRDHPSRFAVAVTWLSPFWLLVLMIGIYGAGLGWRPGAYFMLAGLGGLLVGHLVVGFTEYRRIMRQPWPEVAPLDDDDW